MNTLHWHAIDAQSFPIVSNRFPNLIKAAYAPSAIYRPSDVQDVISYAKDRGVRVVVEFDVPGHAASWGVAYPNVTTYCAKYMHNINNIPLDPTQDFTFQLLQGFFSEMASAFPDAFMHFGGDEVVLGCWLDNPNVVNWMNQHGVKTSQQLLQYFEDKLGVIVSNTGKRMVVWQDLFDNGVYVKSGSFIQVWSDKDTLRSIVSSGIDSLLSAGWYLDQQVPSVNKTTHYEFFDTWKDFYTNEPFDGITNPRDQSYIKGGEACMWGEQVDDNTIDGRIWPRASATAERLWSPITVTDITDATARMVEHSCRLKRRGVRSTPLAPGWCPVYTN
eukprot:TRINITY_DN761_c0_g1_i1.p1 TRINITY_DN761_c0_g1~~TRINITY_DN761_c0_g1_i1.p1  ORF type:complete len:331 (+),score=75.10 TRINITY_DN761_c0_g1_i1:627-1619(+)